MTKMLRIAALALALGALALPVSAEEKDPVAARVNGSEIRYSEVAREIEALGPQAQQLPSQVLVPQILEKVIVTKLVAKLGYEQKLQNDKDVKEALKHTEEQLVGQAYVRRAVQPKITEDKIKALYDQLSAKFVPEDEVRASHILVQTESEAADLIKQIKGGADFAKLATEKSKDTGSAKQGGDLGYFTSKVMVKPFADAAFALKNGEITEKPVKSDFGYHVIKVVDHRKSAPPALADVKEQLANQVGQELVKEMLKDLTTKAKIERFNPDGSPMKAAPADKADK